MTASREFKVLPARERQQLWMSFALPRKAKAIRWKALLPPPAPRSSLAMRAFQQERCRVFWLAETAAGPPLDQKRLYFVDESSLTSTNQMKEFLNRLTPHGSSHSCWRYPPAPGD